jgi:uncharacterized protein (UPF0248 family)
MPKRKGSLDETLSYAIHKDDPRLYSVSYRDKDVIKTCLLADFVTKEEFSEIPITRILQISKEGIVVWRKGQKRVSVKQHHLYMDESSDTGLNSASDSLTK